jgi:hypothetical protein
MVIIDRDVTMDNQQPSPFKQLIGCRSQTKMAVGNSSGDTLGLLKI